MHQWPTTSRTVLASEEPLWPLSRLRYLSRPRKPRARLELPSLPPPTEFARRNSDWRGGKSGSPWPGRMQSLPADWGGQPLTNSASAEARWDWMRQDRESGPPVDHYCPPPAEEVPADFARTRRRSEPAVPTWANRRAEHWFELRRPSALWPT